MGQVVLYASVAVDGYGAPGVVVAYTDDPEVQSGRAFAKAGGQVAILSGGLPAPLSPRRRLTPPAAGPPVALTPLYFKTLLRV